MAVRQARVAVRMAVRRGIAEGPRQRRTVRLAEIEDEGLAGVEAVGPEDAAGRHRVFGVVRASADRPDRHRRHHRRVAGAARVGVDHGEEVARRPVGIAGPQEHEAAAGRRGTRAAGAGVTRRERRRQGESEESWAACAHGLGRGRRECTRRRPPSGGLLVCLTMRRCGRASSMRRARSRRSVRTRSGTRTASGAACRDRPSGRPCCVRRPNVPAAAAV